MRVPGVAAKSAAAVSTKNPKPSTSGSTTSSNLYSAGKKCSVNACNGVVTMAVKFYYAGKHILMAPSPQEQSDDLIELCTKHAQEYKAPNTWTLVHGENFPTQEEFTRQNRGSNEQATGSAGGCIGGFLLGLIAIVILIVAAIGVVWIAIDFFGWLTSGSGGGGGGGSDNTVPFRMPRWRRR